MFAVALFQLYHSRVAELCNLPNCQTTAVKYNSRLLLHYPHVQCAIVHAQNGQHSSLRELLTPLCIHMYDKSARLNTHFVCSLRDCAVNAGSTENLTINSGSSVLGIHSSEPSIIGDQRNTSNGRAKSRRNSVYLVPFEEASRVMGL